MKEFFERIWNSLSTWFIEGRGWATILGAVLTVVLGYILVRIIIAIVRRIINRTRLKGLAGNFIVTIVKILLFFIYIIAVMKVLGIDTSSMVAILAASSLAVTLALQTTLSNFASGMILVGNHPFKEGDFIEAAGVSGTVENISLFSTRIKTVDNKQITIPNSSVASGNIINYSTEPKRRVDLVVPVAYGTDTDKVKKVVTDILEAHPLILHDEGYTVRIAAFGASSIDFTCRAWVNNADYWTVFFDLNEQIKARFETENIEIPYTKIDVNIKNDGGETKSGKGE